MTHCRDPALCSLPLPFRDEESNRRIARSDETTRTNSYGED